MTSSPLTRLLVAAAAVCALAPATASAATLGAEGGSIVYRGEGSEGNSLLVSSRPKDFSDWNSPKWLSFSDSGADRIQVSAPCEATDDPTVAICPMANTPIVIEGSNAKDSIGIFSASEVPDSIPFNIRGNGGDDQLKDAYNAEAGRTFDGGPGNDKIEAYQGNDVLEGGDGNDELDGGEGDDQLRGGAGDDQLFGDRYKSPGADLMDGGPGSDTVEEWSIPDANTHPPATVSLDGQANDGRPGEGDNVVNVENFKQYISLTFVGTDGPEVVELVNPGDEASSDLKGLGGNDKLIGWDTDDKVDGGAGDDIVEGGMGNDVVTGGPGKDVIYGDATSSYCTWYSCKVPFGNDVINARDGEADNVTCGVGEDTVTADAVDTIAADCEKVHRSGAAAGGGGGGAAGGAGGGTGAGGGGGAGASGVALLGAATRSALLAGRLGVSVPCAGACTVTVRAAISAKDARRLRLKGTSLGSGSRTMLSGGTAKVTIKVSKKAKKALKRARKGLKVTLSVSTRGADGKTVTVRRAVTLR